jgi:integrase
MSRPRPPYLHRTVTRHGAVAWYVWRRPGPKVRIRGEYGSRKFMAAYRAALYGQDGPEKPAGAPGTLSALIASYRVSPQWAALAVATRKQRGNIFDRIERKAGDMAVSEVDAAMIKDARDGLGLGAAKHFVQTMRGLFRWAVETERAGSDPTEGVRVARPKTEGFHTWTDAEVAAFEARWQVGTRQRLWLAILLYTGLRRGDACALGQRHVKDGVIEFRAAKTGTPIVLPLAPELAEVIAASPVGAETFIATVHGKPMSKEFFGNLFREACIAAGLPHCSAHGLRKAAAVKLAEAGATVPELNAIFGWTGAKQALVYTTKADRARLARQAMERLKK